MADKRLNIIISAVDKASKELRDLQNGINGVENSAKKGTNQTKNLGAEIGSLKNYAIGAIAVIGGLAVAIDKGLEAGRAGAAAKQTGESFEFMTQKIGLAPDLLDQLSDAAKGTIPDLELMSSTALLLAGTQGELAVELGNATPKLLEIAKAANKINPALGDTTFLYDSLARGIKRASPLILDNLGIVVNVGEANKAYAKSIGKTIEALTEEEKKIALLNEVLEKGNILIDQAGGTTDSATDAFDRLSASTDNLKSAMQQRLAPAMTVVAERLTDVVQNSVDLMDASDVLKQAMDSGRISAEEANQQYYLMRIGVKQASDVIKEFTVATSDYSAEVLDATLKTEEFVKSEAELKREMNELKLFMAGPLGDENLRYQEDQTKLIEKNNELIAKIQELEGLSYRTPEQQVQLDGLHQDLEENRQKMQEIGEEHDKATKRILLNIIEQRLAIDGLTADEAEALGQIAKDWNLVDKATFDAYTGVNNYINQLGGAKVKADDLKNAVQGIPVHKTITLDVLRKETLSTIQQLNGIGWIGRQHGGTVEINKTYLVGEAGPELFMPGRSGSIVPNNKLGGGATINLTYAPAISLTDKAEVETKLIPYIEAAMRKMR